MQATIEILLKMMPVWFGVGFFGPAIAEIFVRTPAYGLRLIGINPETVYIITMMLGGLYGIVAWRSGRWI